MWDRSMLGMTGSELDLHEALTAMERALGCDELEQCTRRALAEAAVLVRRELTCGRSASRDQSPDGALG
jgi:hypothetical protein